MSDRFKMKKVAPAAYKAIYALEDYIGNTSVSKLQQELIRVRASQLNGCSYCLNMHTQDAIDAGEKEYRLHLVAAWKEATNVFNEEERLLLAMTEEITLIHQHGLSDDLYEKAIALFGEEKTAEIIMVIIGINVWNRIGVGLKMQPVIRQDQEINTNG